MIGAAPPAAPADHLNLLGEREVNIVLSLERIYPKRLLYTIYNAVLSVNEYTPFEK